jgi:hypothetical protein
VDADPAIFPNRCGSRGNPRHSVPTLRDHIMALFIVQIAYDADAEVWYVDKSDVAGLRAEAPTSDALIARIPTMAAELLEENEPGLGEVAIEIIAHMHARISIPAAA